MDRIRGLKLIQQWGTGLEGVEVKAATQRGIAVANVPSAGSGNAESVAEWCVMAAIAVSRQLPLLPRNIRRGAGWGGPPGNSLLGRTAGIIGCGGIGKAAGGAAETVRDALAGSPTSMESEPLNAWEWSGSGVPERLPDLLRQSDYVFLCLPVERTDAWS